MSAHNHVSSLNEFIDSLQLGAVTTTDTDVTIPYDVAAAIIDDLKLLRVIERNLRKTPEGALLYDSERAAIHFRKPIDTAATDTLNVHIKSVASGASDRHLIDTPTTRSSGSDASTGPHIHRFVNDVCACGERDD